MDAKQELCERIQAAEQLSTQITALAASMLVKHDHEVVINALFSAYINVLVRYPCCVATAQRALPAIASQLDAIAAAMNHRPPATSPATGPTPTVH